MQSLKKYGLFILIAVFVASVAIVPAHAQSARIAADIPFDFAVGSAHLQAGSYKIVTQGTMGTFIGFTQADGKTRYTLLLRGGDSDTHDGQPYLVFHRCGAESFLKKIVFSNGSYVLPRSKRERHIQGRPSTVEQMEVSAGGSR